MLLSLVYHNKWFKLKSFIIIIFSVTENSHKISALHVNHIGCALCSVLLPCLAEWVAHAVDSFGINGLILSETSQQPVLLAEGCVSK